MKSKVKITKETYVWKDEDDKGIIYYKDGKKHREDGPAVELKNGTMAMEWWIDGQRHRDDGPACIYQNPDEGDFFYEWFRNGERVTEQEVEQLIVKKNLKEKLESTLEPRHHEKKNKI